MDIREFYKRTQENQTQNTSKFNEQSNNQNSSNQDFSEYQDTINKYKDLSQEDLYSELISQASDLKAKGKLDTSMLEQLSSTLNPMLNDEQKQMLNNIINRIK